MANIESKVETLIAPKIEELGYELYDVEYTKQGKDLFLRIFIDDEKGIDLKTISYLLGHSDITVTANIYLHITREKAINSIEVLNKVNG